jgi:hypothetical protein
MLQLRPKTMGISQRLLHWLLVLLITSFFWVISKRIHAIYSSASIAPGTAITSGCEEESIFALWRIAHGDKIYIPKTAPPYAATYFNWGFYRTYSAATGLFWKPGHEANAIFWSRVFTALTALIGVVASSIGFRRVLGSHTPKLLPIAIACFIFTGPLVGWWFVTIRPDIGAMVAEAACVWIFLLYNHEHPTLSGIVTIVGSYIAWSFKPTCIAGLTAICLFLLFRRQWKTLLVVVASMISLWVGTLALGGEAYRSSILDTAINNAFYLTLGLSNFFTAAKAGAPLITMTMIAFAFSKGKTSTEPTNQLARDAANLGMIGTLTATSLMLIASCKLGAAPNYFFPALFMTSLWATGMMVQKSWQPSAWGFTLVAIILQAGLVCGKWGSLDITNQSNQLSQRWSVYKDLPEPRFSADLRLNFPWLNPSSPPIMLAYNYSSDRARGVSFMKDGLGGMIEARLFKTLLLPADTEKFFDQTSMTSFTRDKIIGDYAVYLLKSTNGTQR